MIGNTSELFNPPPDQKTDQPSSLYVAWCRDGKHSHWVAASQPTTYREAWDAALRYRMTAAVGEREVVRCGELPGQRKAVGQ